MQCAYIVIAATVFAASAIAEDQVVIAVEDAPPNVVETALATAPGATFDVVSVEQEESGAVYEFRGVDYAGRRIEVDIHEDGSVQEVEMQIAMSEVPDVVIAALAEAAPNFTPSTVELSVRNAGGLIVYEFEGAADQSDIHLEISESGEVLVVGEDAQS